MKRMDRVLAGIDRGVGVGLKILSTSCMVLLLLLLAGNVLSRYILTMSYMPYFSFGWFDEIVEWTFAWMVFFGAAALWREHEHFTVDFLIKKIAGSKSGCLLAFVLDLICLGFFVVLTVEGWVLAARAQDWTPIFMLPKKWLYLCIPASGLLMSLYTIRDLLGDCSRMAERFRSRPLGS